MMSAEQATKFADLLRYQQQVTNNSNLSGERPLG